MSAPLTDSGLIARAFASAAKLQVRTSLDAEQADDSEVADYLQEFANSLDDLMGDSLTRAEQALELNERLRNTDPKARRVNMPVEPATGGGAP